MTFDRRCLDMLKSILSARMRFHDFPAEKLPELAGQSLSIMILHHTEEIGPKYDFGFSQQMLRFYISQLFYKYLADLEGSRATGGQS